MNIYLFTSVMCVRRGCVQGPNTQRHRQRRQMTTDGCNTVA